MFKVGDKVRCIKPDDYYLEKNKIYTIIGYLSPSNPSEDVDVNNPSEDVDVLLDELEPSWMQSRFELVEDYYIIIPDFINYQKFSSKEKALEFLNQHEHHLISNCVLYKYVTSFEKKEEVKIVWKEI